MGKQKRYATMAEIEEILSRLTEQDNKLNQQDELLKQISSLIKGSVTIGLQGMLPMMSEMKISMGQIVSDVAHLQRWKKHTEDYKGTFTIRTSVIITRILAIIGGIGVLVGAALGATQLLDWMHAQGILKQ